MDSFAKITGVIIAIVMLASCGATHTAISKRQLDVKTQMSETVFLEPVSPVKQVVYVRVRNTSGMVDLNIEPAVISAIEAHGYQVTKNPEKAYYLLQANVLQAGKLDDPNQLVGGYGDAIGTGLMGAAVGGLANGEHGAWTGAAAGAAIGLLADAFIDDVTYAIITDIQISERSQGAVKESTKTTLAQGNLGKNTVDVDFDGKQDYLKGRASAIHTKGSGSSTVTSQAYDKDTNWRKYRTRVTSYANKVNLKFEEAKPQLVSGLVQSIAGIF